MTRRGSIRAEESGPDPVPAVADPAAAFACELRDLRERAGSPTFRELARLTHFSPSTLAEATSGRRLPTEQVVRAFAAGCREDPDEWARRLHQTCQSVTASPPATVLPDHDAVRASNTRRLRLARVPRWTTEVVGAAAFLIVGFVVGGPITGKPTPHAAAAATIIHPATDGTDPIVGGCTADARLIDKSVLTQGDLTVGALELEYSPVCAAGWSRVYLYPAGVHAGLTMALSNVAVIAADGTSSAYTARLDKQLPDFTDVITTKTHGGCLKATATLVPPGGTAIRAAITCDALGAPPTTPAAHTSTS